MVAPDHTIRQCIQRSALFPGKTDGWGRKVPSEARRSVAPGENVRPAALPCQKSQLTRQCGELPACVWDGAPVEDELVHVNVAYVTEHLWWTDIESCKALKWLYTSRFFYLPWNSAPWKVPPGAHAPALRPRLPLPLAKRRSRRSAEDDGIWGEAP